MDCDCSAAFQLPDTLLAINIVDACGLINETCRQWYVFKQLYITNKTERFSFKVAVSYGW